MIHALRGAVWGWLAILGEKLGVRVSQRLSTICRRMERLAARFEAGLPMQRAPRSGVVSRAAAESAGPSQTVKATRIWPYQFGWLLELKKHHAAHHTNRLRAVLEQPEMVALLLAAPQAARILTPLCRMLGIERAVLRPRVPGVAAEVVAEKVVRKRVRKKREPVDFGRYPWPRGVLAWARREGFGKVPRD